MGLWKWVLVTWVFPILTFQFDTGWKPLVIRSFPSIKQPDKTKYSSAPQKSSCSLHKAVMDQEGFHQYVQYHPHTIPDLKEFTLCAWHKFHNHSSDHPIFSYSTPKKARAILSWISNATPKKTFLMLAVNEHTIYRINYPMSMHKWFHICQSWSGKTGEWQVWVNHERIGRGYYNLLVGKHIQGGGIAISGQVQERYKDGVRVKSKGSGLCGEITLLQFYKAALTVGKAFNTHKYHHAHRWNIDGTQDEDKPPPPKTPAPPTSTIFPPHPDFENGQLKPRLPVFMLLAKGTPKPQTFDELKLANVAFSEDPDEFSEVENEFEQPDILELRRRQDYSPRVAISHMNRIDGRSKRKANETKVTLKNMLDLNEFEEKFAETKASQRNVTKLYDKPFEELDDIRGLNIFDDNEQISNSNNSQIDGKLYNNRKRNKASEKINGEKITQSKADKSNVNVNRRDGKSLANASQTPNTTNMPDSDDKNKSTNNERKSKDIKTSANKLYENEVNITKFVNQDAKRTRKNSEPTSVATKNDTLKINSSILERQGIGVKKEETLLIRENVVPINDTSLLQYYAEPTQDLNELNLNEILNYQSNKTRNLSKRTAIVIDHIEKPPKSRKSKSRKSKHSDGPTILTLKRPSFGEGKSNRNLYYKNAFFQDSNSAASNFNRRPSFSDIQNGYSNRYPQSNIDISFTNGNSHKYPFSKKTLPFPKGHSIRYPHSNDISFSKGQSNREFPYQFVNDLSIPHSKDVSFTKGHSNDDIISFTKDHSNVRFPEKFTNDLSIIRFNDGPFLRGHPNPNKPPFSKVRDIFNRLPNNDLSITQLRGFPVGDKIPKIPNDISFNKIPNDISFNKIPNDVSFTKIPSNDGYAYENPFPNTNENLFETDPKYHGLDFIPKKEMEKSEYEPAEWEVRKIAAMCSECSDDPFRKANIISWIETPKKLMGGAKYLPTAPKCKSSR